jgi:hypothetical protein
VKRCLFLALPLALATSLVMAQTQPRALGTFERWQAWEYGDGGARVCYVTTTPSTSETKPPGARRGDIRITISHRPGAKARDEVSFQAGYPIKDDKAVVAMVDRGKNFEFSRRAKGQDETIWTKDADMDKQIIGALRGGKELVVNGTSRRGTTTTDRFPLAGFSKALEAANLACGLR